MAAHFTVYCKRSMANVTPEALFKGFQIADFHTIAEDDVDEELIESAMEHLRMENLKPDQGFCHYRLHYRPNVPEPVRQIDIERYQTSDEVCGALAEVIEDLEMRGAPILKRIRKDLDATIDIVDASFGSTPEQAMAPILASEIARWLAEKYGGIIRGPGGLDKDWWKLGPKHHEYQKI